MKKSLLTFVLLLCVIMAGAATTTKDVKARNPKAPVSLKSLSAQGSQTVRKSAQKKAEAQTIDLNINDDECVFKYYQGYGFWYFCGTDETGEYQVRLAWYGDSKFGTFSYEDLDTDYSWIGYETEEDYAQLVYQDCTEFTTAEENGYVILSGKLVCDDGNTYVLHGKCLMPQPETYDIEGGVITMASYNDEDGDWDIRFKDADSNWKVCLDLMSSDGSLAGTYTMDDAYNAFVEDLNEDEDYYFTEMNVTITLPEGVTDPKDGCEITGVGKDINGTTFNFHMKKNPPIQPKEVKNITVEVTTAEWPSENTGGSYYELTEKDNPQNKWVLSLYEKTGEVTHHEGIDTTETYRINAETEQVLKMDHGSITQTFDAEKLEVAVVASLVMNDSIQYDFSFATPITTEGEETLTFTDLMVDNSYSEWGSTTLNASDDKIQFSAELTDYASIPDEFTDANCRITLARYVDGDFAYVNSNAIIYAKGEFAADGTPVFKAKFLGDDNYIYTVDASWVKPVVTDTLHITITDGEFASDDAGNCYSYDSEDQYIWIKTMTGEQIEGHFTLDDLNNNSCICRWTESGMPRYYYLCDADFTVTANDPIYTITGTCQAGPYFIYLTMDAKVPGLAYDNYESNVDVIFTQDDIVDFSLNTEDEYNQYLYIKLVNKERNDELCLAVSPEEFDGDNLPAGDYEISSWTWGNYVQAGQSDEYSGSIYPSYYAQLDDEGYPLVPYIWFLCEGTMTVTVNEGVTSFVINAQNSYGRTVQVVLADPTGIKAAGVDADKTGVQKILKNGQIIIRKGDAEYNVIGQRR